MFDEKYHVALNEDEQSILINVVNEYRNDMMAEGKDTTDVDEVLLKVAKAKRGRFKEKECDLMYWCAEDPVQVRPGFTANLISCRRIPLLLC